MSEKNRPGPTRSTVWRWIAGPMLTIVIGVTIEVVSRRTTFEIRDPGVLYLVGVVASIYIGGIGSGIVGAVVALVLGLVLFSLPGPLFRYTGEDYRYLITLFIAAPFLTLIVGILKHRAERRVREAARFEALEQYRNMVEELDAIVWERDPETLQITFVSRRAVALLGYPLERWLKEPDFWVQCLHPDDRDRTVSLFREAASRGAPQVLEYRMRASDGRFVWLRDAIRTPEDVRRRGRVRGVVIDITKRKRAEEALRESEARKGAILNSALDAIVVIDRQGRVIEFNPAAEALFDYRREEALGREMASLIIPPHMRDVHRRALSRYLETGVGTILGRRIELMAMRSDGSEFPVELAIIDMSVAGETSFTGFVRDITHRKQTEQALRESESNYRMLMEKASDGIVISDLDGNFEEVNAKFCEMLGRSREELFGINIRDLISPDDLARLPLRLEELRAGKSILVERWLQRKDGTTFPVEISARRLDEQRLQGIYRDISERKKVEEELRQALSVLGATLDSTTDGILVVDRQGRITSLNAKFIEMWSIPEDILASRDDNRALAFVLDQLSDPQGFLSKVRELYSMPEAESFDVLHFKDGRVFERYSKPQRIAGAGVGRVWSFRDVTESRRAEQALHQREEQLRQAQKMEAIGRLAGGVAHDFNNLLTAILGNSSLLLEELKPGDPRRQGAEEIKNAAERAASLTRQLLAFGRKQVLELKVLDLSTAVADMHAILRRLIGEHIELVLVPGPDLGRVLGDPGQLEQVILNLVVNARDAMPEGGKLVVETANVDVDESIARTQPPLQVGRYVMLAVSDTGVGMDPDTLAHVFEPFFTTKERGRGTGLGLSTVYGIVRQSGGHIWVYSEPGRGSTFKIYLPRVGEEAPSAEPRVEVWAGDSSGTETVLLVEDEGVVRALVRNTLTQRGYRVLEAENGAQALQISAKHRGPLELLLTDVVMPGMSGRELAEKLMRERPGMRVLYISGYTDEIARHVVLSQGVGFLQKPFSLEALANKVREMLDAGLGSEAKQAIPPASAPADLG